MAQDGQQEKADRMSALRERSGQVRSDDPLVSFLYQLMRDHLASGVVEGLMGDAEKQPILFTNGWLANYAKDIAERLRKKG
jgi:hypothetical protein